MRGRRTHFSNCVYRLPGGTEDNDLWVHRDQHEDGTPLLRSTWELSDEDRAIIAAGGQVELVIWGDQQPPVCMMAVDYPLGAPPRPLDDSEVPDAG